LPKRELCSCAVLIMICTGRWEAESLNNHLTASSRLQIVNIEHSNLSHRKHNMLLFLRSAYIARFYKFFLSLKIKVPCTDVGLYTFQIINRLCYCANYANICCFIQVSKTYITFELMHTSFTEDHCYCFFNINPLSSSKFCVCFCKFVHVCSSRSMPSANFRLDIYFHEL